jgi:hypothetical protein
VRGRDILLNVARLGFAALGVAAISYQAAALNTGHTFYPGNFFSFFTIQANILAATLLALTAIVPQSERTALFDAVRGAVTLYMPSPEWSSPSSCPDSRRSWIRISAG